MLVKPILVVCFLLLHVVTASRKKHHKKKHGRKQDHFRLKWKYKTQTHQQNCNGLDVPDTNYLSIDKNHKRRQQAWENGPHLEGDIMVDGCNNMKDPTLWPDGIVPYELSKLYNSEQKHKIIRAMDHINHHTCVQFVPRTIEHEHFIYVVGFPGSGCATEVGYQKKNWKCYVHWVHLEDEAGCLHRPTILHELLHVLGFYHQQTAYDRDDFVTIVWSNIKDRRKKDFQKRPKGSRHTFQYDYESIMHSSSTFLSKNGDETIVPKEDDVEIGEATDLSDLDWEKLKTMYECSERKGIQQPWEKGSHSEGDIMVDDCNSMKDPTLWPDGIVPYELSKLYDPEQKHKITRAMAHINLHTCVQFVPRTAKHEHFIYVVGFPGSGCSTEVGYQKKNWKCYVHWVHLEDEAGCLHRPTILHELLHVLGFYHQQTAYDRDNFVTIAWSNIKNGRKKDFQKRPKGNLTFQYDYKSIMHSSSTFLSKNGDETIIPKEDDVEIGEATNLSDLDWDKLKTMYKCSERRGKLSRAVT